MALDQKMVEYLAHLARLAIREGEENNEIQENLTRIVEMVNKISSANTENIQPMAHPLQINQRLRKDAVSEENQREKLLALSSETESGLFLVPNIME